VTNPQEFTFGYHLNTWDLGGLFLGEGLEIIRRNGFDYVEALARDEFSHDFARRFMGTGFQPVPMGTSDITFLSRIELFSVAAAHGLKLSSLYCNREFINPLTWEKELATLDAITRLLHGFDAPGIVVGGGPPAAPGTDHSHDTYVRFAAALTRVAERADALGMWAAYHPHIDTFVETREQLDRLMNELDAGAAGLCIDTAHLTLAGSDAVAALRDYASAIKYVHFKDVASCGITGPDRYTAFRPLGEGVVDIAGAAAQLRANNYRGLVIIELDTTDQEPEKALRTSVAYIKNLGLELRPTAAARL